MSQKSSDQSEFTLYLPRFRGFDWVWGIPVADYLNCKRKRKPLSDGRNYERFVTPNDPHVELILESLIKHVPLSRKSPKNIAQIIVDFTQHFPYQEKEGSFVKYPIETLCEFGGNCEDMSVLAVSLLTAADIDSCFFLWEDHVAIGIDVPAKGEYCYLRKREYYIANPVGSDFINYTDKSRIGASIPGCRIKDIEEARFLRRT